MQNFWNWMVIGVLGTTTPAYAFRVIHWNIKEFDTQKIFKTRDQQSTQGQSVLAFFKTHPWDLLSLNEIQYDLPGVPNSEFNSRGLNLKRIAKLIGHSNSRWSFDPANTGNQAKRNEKGQYETNPNAPYSRTLADPLNFGVFPGQYSTGLLFKNKIKNKKVFSKLKWKEVFPERDLTSFRDAHGNPIPEDIELFDKNFTDLTLEIEQKPVHIILLHTVPSFEFGQKNSMNIARNADQLRFLEWYLTGSTSPSVADTLALEPLSKNDRIIAMGDWNVDYQKKTKEGAPVLQRLFKKMKLWMKKPPATYWGSSLIQKEPIEATLDYLVTSQHFQIIKSGVYRPKYIYNDWGCNAKKVPSAPSGKVLISYQRKQKTCYAWVNEEFASQKQASDHLPIWAELKLID